MIAPGLTKAQYDYLTARIKASRVGQHRGNSHVEAWDIRRHLIRIFGFGGFDVETKLLDLVAQIEHVPGSIKRSGGSTNDRTAWTVVYRAEVRLIIKDPAGNIIARYEDAACGDSANQPVLGDAHDHAVKTALSQGLKRCVVNLGDQFGLSLYNDGKTDPVVNQSLVVPGIQVDATALATAAAQDAPVVPEERPAVEQEAPPVAAQEEPPSGGETRTAPATDAAMVTEVQHKRMHALWKQLGYDGEQNRAARLQITSRFVNRRVTSSTELTAAEADTVIERQEARRRELREQGARRAEHAGEAA